MTHTSVALIGAGNMGAALLGGLIQTGFAPEHLWITDPDTQKLAVLQKRYSVHTTTDNAEAVLAADTVILALKPQVMSAVIRPLAEVFRRRDPLIITIAAGIRLAALQGWLPAKARLIRCMPNTPALTGHGATALFAGPDILPEERTCTENLFKATGLVLWVDNESQIDIVTALSGSGPAYYFYILDALISAASALGLPADKARQLAVQTALGAALMAAEAKTPVKELERQVTSPQGTTEAAIRVFDQEHLSSLLARALQAAHSRSIELAESFNV